jgi:hypothetical protein
MEVVTERTAAALFADLGIDRETARRVLRAGLVRPVQRMRGVTLYRECELAAFVSRQLVEPPEVTDGVVVVFRTHPRRADPDSPVGWSGLDLTAPPAEQLVAARAGGRGMSAVTRTYVSLLAQRDGCVPMLATIGGFVGLAAEIIGPAPHDAAERRSPAWQLRGAGAWADEWLGLHVPTGRGGSSWRLLGPAANPLVSRSGSRQGDALRFPA